jgi:hypothetical protein
MDDREPRVGDGFVDFDAGGVLGSPVDSGSSVGQFSGPPCEFVTRVVSAPSRHAKTITSGATSECHSQIDS